jgi:hypothetical protein
LSTPPRPDLRAIAAVLLSQRFIIFAKDGDVSTNTRQHADLSAWFVRSPETAADGPGFNQRPF